ncbi:cobalamin-binding protein [Candidatus Micrarchaeota archaeon]|nr:cobalamin-binding protein [Candidatus Micrarchaeota archaeon]
MRIISLAPSNTEIIFALGSGDELVGRTAYCDFPSATKNIGKVGDWTKPDISKIKALKPDLILTSTIVQKKLAIELEEDHKLPAIHIEVDRLSGVIQSFAKIGALISKEEEAKKLTAEFLLQLAQIRLANQERETRPRIYVEEWHKPPFGSGNWVGELVQIAGGEYFPIKAGERSREINDEEIQKFDPELIFVSICGLGNRVSKELITKRKSWRELNAVKNDKIVILDDSLLNRPGPRLIIGARTISNEIEKIRIKRK